MHDEPADQLARFRWHPEPELLGIGDEATSRAALERLGAAAWRTSLDYLYREGVRRGTGPDSYAELRERHFGATGGRRPGAGRADAGGADPRRVHRPAGAAPAQPLPPRRLLVLHAAAGASSS